MGLSTPLLDKSTHDEHHGARPPAFAPVASADMSGGLPPPPAYNSLAVTAPAQGASQAGEASAPVFAGADSASPAAAAPDAHARTTELELCKGCAAKIPADIKFCGSCGAANLGASDGGGKGGVVGSGGRGGGGGGGGSGGAPPGTFVVQLPIDVVAGQVMKVLVPAGLPGAGEPATFSVPAGVSGGSRILVPLPTTSGASPGPPGLAKVAKDCFRVQLPPNFQTGQLLQVPVPAGYPQAGQMTRFQVPPNMRGGQYIDVPLPALQGGGVRGNFRVRLPLTATAGAMLKVTVPEGYAEVGRDQTFIVPAGAPPGSLVDVPLPAGGAYQPGVYHTSAAAGASSANAPLRGVPATGMPASIGPHHNANYAEPPVKNYSV